jgi:uncharacterized protein with GYD domain
MPRYMLQFTYTADAWAALTLNPADRSEPLRALAEKLGGKFVSLDYTMGEYDGVAIIELPDDTTAMAAVLAAGAPGHIRATRTTRLIPPSEAMAAMRKAQGAGYKAPQR